MHETRARAALEHSFRELPKSTHFSVHAPAQQRLPFVFNSPHSGRNYTPGFLQQSRLDEKTIRRSEDCFIDMLFSGVVALGAPLLTAEFPRAFLDVNREPYELDQRMFAERLPAHANIRSVRVAGGLGTIPRVVAEGKEIYRRKLTLADGLGRVEAIYRPYHETLRRLIARTAVEFGFAVLVDCHSMPSTIRNSDSSARPDIVIGDRYGTSCVPEITHTLTGLFKEKGYQVTRNKPYAGGFITEHYGRPLRGLHAVQIEINRALYMNEETLEPGPGFGALAEDIDAIMQKLTSMPDAALHPMPSIELDIAAE